MKKAVLLFLIFLALGFSSAQSVGSYQGSLDVGLSNGQINIGTKQSSCGNGIVEPHLGEQCDGSNLAGMTCTSLLGIGFTGTLSCKPTCLWDTTSCAPVSGPQGGGGGGGGSSQNSQGSSVSGSSSKAKSCIEDWSCSEWGPCENEKQYRTCTDLNNCGTEKTLPPLSRDCTSKEVEKLQTGPGLASITGAAVSVVAKPGSWWVIFPILLLIYLAIREKNKKAKQKANKKRKRKKRAKK